MTEWAKDVHGRSAYPLAGGLMRAEQEPVAWMVWAGVIGSRPVWPPHRTVIDAGRAAEEIKSTTIVKPLYAHPAPDQGAVQERDELRTQLAASDAALRESRENDAISTATANDLRDQVLVLVEAHSMIVDTTMKLRHGDPWALLEDCLQIARAALATVK
jgi:hypothetical protein